MEQEIAHVLFMDIVGYSRLADAAQANVFRRLQEMVGACPSVAAATRDNNVVRTPTGDGMALSFFGDSLAPLRCAAELTAQLANDPVFEIRMGINSGPVVRQIDINRNTNVSGDGINTAQRVMDFGDSRHVLVSEDFAQHLRERDGELAAHCHDIGTATAKHGKRVHLFNFYDEAIGTPAIPLKVRKDPEWLRPKELRLGLTNPNLFVGTLQIIGWLIAKPEKWREHVTQIDPWISPSFSAIEVTRTQLKSNPELRRLLLQVYVLAPLLVLIAVAALSAPGGRANLVTSIAAVASTSVLTVILGAAPGIGFLLVNAVPPAISGIAVPLGSAGALQLAAMAVAFAWGTINIPKFSAAASARSARRELLGALGGAVIAVTLVGLTSVITYGVYYVGKVGMPERAIDVITFSAIGFVLLNAAFILRWGRWSRAFVTGQVVAGILALGYGFVAGLTTKQIASRTIELAPAQAFFTALSINMAEAMAVALAFATAEKFSGPRAAVAAPFLMICGDLMLDVTVSQSLALRLMPLVAVVTGFATSRRQEHRRSGAAAASSALRV